MASANVNKNRDPYRRNCSGQWTGKFFIPRRDHFRASENGFAAFTNQTKIPQYGCSPVVNLDPPSGGFETCPQVIEEGGTPAPCSTGCTPPATGTPCAPPAGCPTMACLAGQVSFPNIPGYASNNCFLATSGKVNRAVCWKYGFKNVQAYKAWHGAPGWLDDCPPVSGQPGTCTFQPYTPTPPGTRYLTATVTGSATFTGVIAPDPDCEYQIASLNCSCAVSIGQTTGNANITSCTNTCSATDNFSGPFDCESEWNLLKAMPGSCPVAGTFTDVADACGFGFIGTATVTVTNTEYTYSFSNIIPVKNCTGITQDGLTVSFSVVLSDGYTSDMVNADTEALLAAWDLTDDASYPWRLDTLVTQAPLVCCDENGPTSPLGFIGSPCGTSGTFTGDIIGAPSPTGYAPFYDTAHPIYTQVDPGDGSWSWQVTSVGQFAPGWCPQATKWTDNFTAMGLYGGAYTGMGSAGGFPFQVVTNSEGDTEGLYVGFCFKQKWSEIILFVKPSHNFARPCGPADRSTYDQTTIDCVHNPTGNLRWASAPCNCDDPGHPGPAAPSPCPANDPTALDQWNDIGIKGDYVTREFAYNARDVGEWIRLWSYIQPAVGCTNIVQGTDFPATAPRGGSTLVNIEVDQRCASYTNCCPQIVAYRPNGEAWNNGATPPVATGLNLGLPRVAMDAKYGAFQYNEVNQWMIDPLWQSPLTPACDGTLWVADDGTCQKCQTDILTDITTCYYEIPYEECRSAVPSGAPALPSGIILGAVNTSPGVWVGNLSGQPEIGGASCPTPWAYWHNQITTCCNPGEDCP